MRFRVPTNVVYEKRGVEFVFVSKLFNSTLPNKWPRSDGRHVANVLRL